MAGSFTATTASSLIIAADPIRRRLTIQNYGQSNAAMNIGIGAAAVVATGLRIEPGEILDIPSHLASQPIYGITNANTAVGGWL